VGLHSLRAVSEDDLSTIVQSVGDLDPGAPIHLHISEQMKEVEACHEISGARPIDWLLDHAPVDGAWTLIHATHGSRAELDRVAASGAVIGLCPTTEANLGDGAFPLDAFLRSGGRVAIGSDSQTSIDPREELRWLEYQQRLSAGTRIAFAHPRSGSTGRGLLDHAWQGGSRSAGRAVGALAPGSRADWIVLDPDHPTLVGQEGDALLDAWVFSGNRSPIAETWVGGHRVVESGGHRSRDAIEERYRAAVRRIVARI
jgi:formimidoylglutamate deiminase